MKKVKLILQNNNIIIEKKVLDCVEKDEFYIMNYDNLILKFKYNEKNITFIRESNDDIFYISNINNINGIFTLKNPYQEFDIEFDVFRYNYINSKNIELEYKIKGSEEVVCIMLYFYDY